MTRSAKKKKEELPTGMTCKCGKFSKYPPYVYAHWCDVLTYTCECGRKYELCEGVAEEI